MADTGGPHHTPERKREIRAVVTTESQRGPTQMEMHAVTVMASDRARPGSLTNLTLVQGCTMDNGGMGCEYR